MLTSCSTSGENAHGYIVYHTDTDLQGIGWSFSNGQGNEWVLLLLVLQDFSLVILRLFLDLLKLCTELSLYCHRFADSPLWS